MRKRHRDKGRDIETDTETEHPEHQLACLCYGFEDRRGIDVYLL
jgi:hypothetical protein